MSAIQLDHALISQWILEKLHPSKAEEQIQAHGFEPMVAEAYIKEFKKIRAKRRQKQGFIWTSIGAFLGFVSCVLSLTNPFPELYDVFLYGMISLCLVFICVGLYYIFE